MYTKTFSIVRFLIVVSLLMVGITKPTSADMVAGVSLNAQAIVDAFNSLNNGRGAGFTTESSILPSNFFTYKKNGNFDYVDTSAYYPKGAPDRFFSVCVEPNRAAAWDGADTFARLNYINGKSMTYSQKDLTVGTAYLYSLYATTDLPESAELAGAIRFLMDDWKVGVDDAYATWNNPVLQELLGINNDVKYWTSVYNPDAYYDEIGNYSVFVMNIAWDHPLGFFQNNAGQNVLYIANAANPYGPENPVTPEPATMLMFGTGLLALPFVRRLRTK